MNRGYAMSFSNSEWGIVCKMCVSVTVIEILTHFFEPICYASNGDSQNEVTTMALPHGTYHFHNLTKRLFFNQLLKYVSCMLGKCKLLIKAGLFVYNFDLCRIDNKSPITF